MKKEECGELNMLERYLKEHNIRYERIDQDRIFDREKGIAQNERHQINVLDEEGNRLWDAICHPGSYGYERGLLEIYGSIVDEARVGDTVEGWLTAQDVICLIEGRWPE